MTRLLQGIIFLIAICTFCNLPAQAIRTEQASLGAADAASTIVVQDCSTATLQLTGTFMATVAAEATSDGFTWVAIPLVAPATGVTSTTTTSTGLYQLPCSGYSKVRARVSAYTSGTVVATLRCTNGSTLAVAPVAGTVTIDTTGLATEAKQDTAITSLQIIDNVVFGAGTEAGALRCTLPTDGTGKVNAVSAGDVAHDSADSGNPVKLGAKAVPTDGTDPGEAVAEDDRVNLRASLDGLLLTSEQHPFSWSATEAETAATTNDEIVAAPGAGLSLYVCTLVISNGATAGDYKLVEDTAGTPVTKVEKIYTGVTGGAVIPFKPCIRISANKNIGITSTTVTTGSYTVSGYTAP